MRNYCDCNQGRLPCNGTCKMQPKLADAVRRYGFVESKPVGGMEALLASDLRSAMGGNGDYSREEILKCEVNALQELVTQRDMEIDYLATARPTTLRLDWYLILLSVVVHSAWWMWGR